MGLLDLRGKARKARVPWPVAGQVRCLQRGRRVECAASISKASREQ